MCVWKPEVNLSYLPQSLATWYLRRGLSLNPRLTDLERRAGQCAPNHPFSTFPVLGPQTCAIMPSFAQRDLRLLVSIHYAWHANISWHYIYYLFSECVCVCLQVPSCHGSCVGVTEQLAELSSFPLLCGSQGSNTGHWIVFKHFLHRATLSTLLCTWTWGLPSSGFSRVSSTHVWQSALTGRMSCLGCCTLTGRMFGYQLWNLPEALVQLALYDAGSKAKFGS